LKLWSNAARMNSVDGPAPRITIVTPSFNQGRYIRQAVRSVLLQEYSNLEYMVLDGGSSDDTLRVLAPYVHRFSHFHTGPDNGQADAIAGGFERSTGEIMGWLNSDDLLAPGALAFVASYFREHPGIDAIYSHRCIIDEQSRVKGYWILPRHRSYLMRRWDMIPQETCFWRRSLFAKTGNLNRSYDFALDYDFFLRCMKFGRFARVNRFLGAFRRHQEAKTPRLLRTKGRAEIAKVRMENGVRILPGEQLIGALFYRTVIGRGWLHARFGKPLPGSRNGVSYEYDEVWEGKLGEMERKGEE
jgi:glycosyltransferase involved in cell wall biosynthesis